MDDINRINVPAYQGELPYIFISYAHKDADAVLPALAAMQKKGFRLWFDLGIEAGTEWSNNIAAHLRDCSVFVAFVSHNSAKSENCLDEIAFAKSHQKPSLMIFLEEEVVLPEGTEMQTARFQRMFLSRQGNLEEFTENLLKSPMFAPSLEERDDSVPVPVPTPTPAPAPAPEEKSTKKKTFPLWIALIAAIVVIAVLCTFIFFYKEPSDPSVEETTGSTPSTTVKEETPIVEMSDDLFDYTFKLDGVVYQLPFSFSQLTDNGWSLSDNYGEEDPLLGGRAKGTVYIIKNSYSISIGVFNNSGDRKPISECFVGEIYVEGRQSTALEISKGIVPLSSEADVIEAFGTPNDRSDGSSGEYSRLSYQEADTGFGVNFYCYKEEPQYNGISIRRYAFGENTAVTNATRPAYLSRYTAPTALGNDLYSGTICVEGDLYRLPAPLDAFLNNGWTISSGMEYVVADGAEYITISRNGKKLELTVGNIAAYQTTPANCFVFRIEEYASSNGPIVELPGGLKLGMTQADVEANIPTDMEKSQSTYTATYRAYDYEGRDFSLSLYVDLEKNALTSITVKNLPEISDGSVW